jgi:hypothetical protein
MIFISYSHKDKKWCDLFRTMAKPLRRYVGLSYWSDNDIKPNDQWPDEIGKALDSATVAVLLVSADFLASDFIADVELPRIFKARDQGKLQILWIALSPCHYMLTRLRDIQAVTDVSVPLNSMGEFGYQSAMMQMCDRLDAIVKETERPIINKALNHAKLDRVQKSLEVLAKPAFRDTHVLLYAGNKWYTQGKVAKGRTATHCWIGDEKNTKSGDTFKIVAITLPTGEDLEPKGYSAIPSHRTKSEEIIAYRK